MFTAAASCLSLYHFKHPDCASNIYIEGFKNYLLAAEGLVINLTFHAAKI